MHKLTGHILPKQTDSSEVGLGSNRRLWLTSIIDNLLGARLVVVPVIHIGYGILDRERYVKIKFN